MSVSPAIVSSDVAPLAIDPAIMDDLSAGDLMDVDDLDVPEQPEVIDVDAAATVSLSFS